MAQGVCWVSSPSAVWANALQSCDLSSFWIPISRRPGVAECTFSTIAIWMKIGYDKFNEPTYWFGRPSNGPATWPKQRRVAQCEKRGVTALHGRNLFLRPEFQASMSHFAKFSQTECGALFVHSHLYGVPGYWFHGLAARSCRLGVPDFGSSSRLPNSNTNSMIRSVFCP